MEMPMDILNKRLGTIRDNGDIDFDNTQAAISIDEELQEKFMFIPQEEIDAVEIVERQEGSLRKWQAGDGPEAIRAYPEDNPAWLYNSAVHALAMYRHLIALQEQEARIKERLARRPAPGVYRLSTGGEQHTAIVTADRRILCPKHRHVEMNDFTDIFDGLPSGHLWVFTPIETGLSA